MESIAQLDCSEPLKRPLPPFVGARYRVKSTDLRTGEDRGYYYCAVVSVELIRYSDPPRHRVEFMSDCGKVMCREADEMQHLEAIENVVPFQQHPPDE